MYPYGCLPFLQWTACSQTPDQLFHLCTRFQSLHLLKDSDPNHYSPSCTSPLLLGQVSPFCTGTSCDLSHLKNKLSLEPIPSSAPAHFLLPHSLPSILSEPTQPSFHLCHCIETALVHKLHLTSLLAHPKVSLLSSRSASRCHLHSKEITPP